MTPRVESLPAADGPPDFDETFSGEVAPERWVAHYLPHWTTPERSAARYRVLPEGGLELRIEDDQLDWRPEDAPLRVSNLQTGTTAGRLGAGEGMHRHRSDGLTVRTETPERLLWAPSGGRIDVTVSASNGAHCMLAAWLVGTEHRGAEDSGEVCIFEIDADAVRPQTTARVGIKAHRDPRLVADMGEVVLPFEGTRPHTWTVVWGAGETVIGCEGIVVRRIAQSTSYPMLLMLDLFEIGDPAGRYPKTAVIHRVRGWGSSIRGITGDTPGGMSGFARSPGST
ncbi:hypothetical protein LQ938_05485 [Microbacterium sp. cx-55]|uniref:hypothetical protein n=1 Tax=Microbacterium sp. cx-55 TaxID=2875948 RepID=UPI001CC0E5DA|nr:hypothetical protein [Microbacterium sp. cx-55]MBZ4488666.1 hypothetical protein [Microbacterium sp. cx-55]UGB36240.1 hypothetical protein LQ938_05485 [Microbacterium sp. cx-55]